MHQQPASKRGDSASMGMMAKNLGRQCVFKNWGTWNLGMIQMIHGWKIRGDFLIEDDWGKSWERWWKMLEFGDDEDGQMLGADSERLCGWWIRTKWGTSQENGEEIIGEDCFREFGDAGAEMKCLCGHVGEDVADIPAKKNTKTNRSTKNDLKKSERRPDLINSAIPAKDKGSKTGLANMVLRRSRQAAITQLTASTLKWRRNNWLVEPTIGGGRWKSRSSH